MDVPAKPASSSSSSPSGPVSSNGISSKGETSSTLRRDVPLEVEYVDVPPLKELCSVRPIQVVNTESRKIHLHSPGSMATLCQWTCGSPENPHFRADFKESYNEIDVTQNVRFVCGRCYSKNNASASSSWFILCSTWYCELYIVTKCQLRLLAWISLNLRRRRGVVRFWKLFACGK